MRTYLIFIFASFVIVATLILIIRSLKTPPENTVPTSVNNTEFNNLPNSDFSISDYFKEEFERKEESPKVKDESEESKFKTCEISGEVVREGTAIYDSTCAE